MLGHKKKSEFFQLRIDSKTKEALLRAAEASHMSASAFALIGIRELLREGETKIILPEYLRLTRTENERQQQAGMAFMNKLLRDRKRDQARAKRDKKRAVGQAR